MAVCASTPYDTILATWELGTPEQIVRPASGTINTIVRVTIAGRHYFLRVYRHPDRAPQEHAVIAHARSRGFPAIGPLPLPSGGTILDRDGQRYALFSQATGQQYARNELTAGMIAAMGANLAALHHALRDFPKAGARRRATIHFDRATTLVGIARLEAVIASREGGDPLDPIALARLAARRAWLERQPGDTTIDPTLLDEQLIHSDYQETNLFFDGARVCAVIDWDQAYLASRAWEIMRVLDYVCAFDPALCQHFLAAYRADQELSPHDLDRAAATYGLMRAHHLWLYEAYYLEGNTRVGQFIHPGGFVPIADRWAQLRPSLAK